MLRLIVLSLCLPCMWLGLSRAGAAEPLTVGIAASPGQFEELERHLKESYRVECVRIDAERGKPVPEAGKLAQCDVLLLNHYRTEPTPEQLQQIQKYFLSGKPVVGTRKASHAYQDWLEIDEVVFGADYGNHFYPNKDKNDVDQRLTEAGKKHPLTEGLSLVIPGGGLYKYTDLADDVEVLIEGAPGNWMPQTWQRVVKDRGGQRVFYTRYNPEDAAKYPEIQELLIGALFWAADVKASELAR